MKDLSPKWASLLASEPETGMGYQIVSVVLEDGRRFDQVVVIEGRVSQVRGHREIPFDSDQIASLVVTHDKWSFDLEK